jgi:hypothetical protein
MSADGGSRTPNTRFPTEGLPTPYPGPFDASEAPQRPHQGPPKSFLEGPAALRALRQHWATLDLRQQWADSAFMRGQLRQAGIRVSNRNEPATADRLRAKLREAGIMGPETTEAVGVSLERYLEINPRLPLWAALALIVESTGRFPT